MNIKSNQPKSPAELVVKDIRRATRRQKFRLRAISKRWWSEIGCQLKPIDVY